MISKYSSNGITITAPIEITCKMAVTKSSLSCLQTLWLVQHCHFPEVWDISDHSSETNNMVTLKVPIKCPMNLGNNCNPYTGDPTQ